MKYNYMKLDDQILHITHNDSDALGCALVIEYYKKQMNYMHDNQNSCPFSRIIRHHFNTVHSSKQTLELLIDVLRIIRHSNVSDESVIIDTEKLSNFKQITVGYNYNDHGMICIPGIIFITDLAVDSYILDLLDDIAKYFDIELLYVDHHASNLENHKRHLWCHVKSNDANNNPRSACKYLSDIILNKNLTTEVIHNYNAFDKLITDISRYDTWLWKTEPAENNENWTTILINSYGDISEAFTEINHELLIKENIVNNLCDIDKFNTLISINEVKKNQYIKKYLNNTVYDMGYNLGFNKPEYATAFCAMVILPENFGNDIMEYIYSNSERNIDIVIGIYPTSCTLSFRKGYNSKIDLSKFAANYGGGGHAAAAGAKLDTESFIKFLKYYYKLLDNKTNKLC